MTGSIERLHRLATHRPDCTFYVGPPWRTVPAEEVVALGKVKLYAVVYPNGEMVDGELGRLGPPPGARFLDPSGDEDDREITLETLAEGRTQVAIELARSLLFPEDPAYYLTSLRNDTDEPVHVEMFAPASQVMRGTRQVAVHTHRRYDREQFASWYGAPGAVIAPGAAVRDVANWGELPVGWVYEIVRASGARFFTGLMLTHSP